MSEIIDDEGAVLYSAHVYDRLAAVEVEEAALLAQAGGEIYFRPNDSDLEKPAMPLVRLEELEKRMRAARYGGLETETFIYYDEAESIKELVAAINDGKGRSSWRKSSRILPILDLLIDKD